MFNTHTWKKVGVTAAALAASAVPALASEADIRIPDIRNVLFFGGSLNGMQIMLAGLVVCALGVAYGWLQYIQTRNLPVHAAMGAVSQIIWETCKTYLFQQGKFLTGLWVLIACCMVYYFGVLSHMSTVHVVAVLLASILGILGSYGVAWFGIRINTVANSRAAFSALRGNPLATLGIPLKSGMSVGLLLVATELFFMICILAFLPMDLAGPCFIGFAIGESLGASALRICGGIFTKIADIGADLMKIVFNLPEDDPRNPGVIADCTGDNAGDSVGPTADGFETYGVTGVALIAFLALALAANPALCAVLIVWLFAMRILMVLTSLASYLINEANSKLLYGGSKDFNLEQPLTNLVWITSAVSIGVTYAASYALLANHEACHPDLWWGLSTIISLGTLAGALIPEFTKVFTSTESRHVKEVVTSSRQGGASLNILSGLVAGNFSAFWTGLCILALMAGAYHFSQSEALQTMMPEAFRFAAPIFAFGLVAFGFLGMGPVTIAVDSFGPVTDNAQSVYELSQIEAKPGIAAEIERDFGFKPDFENAKYQLEKGDGAGNTFKATAKPVLIGTAVVGATTMVFGIIMMLKAIYPDTIEKLSLVHPEAIMGLLMGGAVIYWFTGASTQAVVTGAYRAVVYIKDNMKLDAATAATEASKEVVRICTQYAQRGMVNIFIVIFCFSLSLAFFDPFFFIGYLIGMAFFGLFQAIFMANAGGAWDNAKKIVETDPSFKKRGMGKGSDLHAATVVGDTVGDPFKDTSSVAMNPIIKFATLFGLLAVELAITMVDKHGTPEIKADDTVLPIRYIMSA
ncbi:MAG: K(+)-stimulated pyrophosphate-energized sodium pump, partial [Verrucomicrobiota bacterium]|nr:K(+)-stimulated pyrophosphate-energized sodium pump [Verrucomicrobiota bacterium]